MSVRSLLDPILDQGILNTNFFEGRLLTAQDLRDQQDANRERARRLGRAIGQGVIEGLEVTVNNDGADGTVPVVTVKSGLALTGEGEIIGLPKQDVQVALSRTIDASPTTQADFYACAGPPTTKQLPNGVGVYILVMSPAAGYKDRAPKSGLGDAGVVKGCGSRYVQEGVRFRLVELKPTALSGISNATRALLQDDLLSSTDPALKTDYARASKLRNVLAHLCFGTEELAGFAADPFAREGDSSRYLHYGAIDALRTSGALDDCDVPLALFYWTLDGIAFCDLWSVRRRPVPIASSLPWPPLGGQRAAAEAEARWIQFQSQLADISRPSTPPASIKARDYFRYLPPAGWLRLVGPGANGVSVTTFFQDMTVRFPRPPRFDIADGPVFMDGARLHALMRDAVPYAPIETTSAQAVWLYRVRENRMAADNGAPISDLQTLVVFASGELPYYGTPRFDVAAWDYSNYSSVVLGPGGV